MKFEARSAACDVAQTFGDGLSSNGHSAVDRTALIQTPIVNWSLYHSVCISHNVCMTTMGVGGGLRVTFSPPPSAALASPPVMAGPGVTRSDEMLTYMA